MDMNGASRPGQGIENSELHEASLERFGCHQSCIVLDARATPRE